MNTKIIIKGKNRIYALSIRDIVRCEASNANAVFFLKNEEKIMSSKQLKSYEETLLSAPDFFKIHRSHIININYLKYFFKNGFVKLNNDILLPVAQSKRRLFINYLSLHNQNCMEAVK